jgi:hypothetical protein
MPRIVEVNGVRHVFPDNASDEDISNALSTYDASAKEDPKPAPGDESPLSKAWGGFKDTVGGTVGSLWHAATDPVNTGYKPLDDKINSIGGPAVLGPVIPLSRILGQTINGQIQQARRAGQDIQAAWEHGKRGQGPQAARSLSSAGEHAAAATVPVVGPTITDMADTAIGNQQPDSQDFSKADPARAFGMAAGNVALAESPKIVEGLPAAAEATGKAAKTAGKVTAGAIKGAIKGGMMDQNSWHGIPYPAAIAGAMGGAAVGHWIGREMGSDHGAILGAALGAAPPIISSAIKGAREALHPPSKAEALQPGFQPVPAPPVTFRQPDVASRAPKPAPPLGRVINPEPEPVSRTMPPPPVSFRQPDVASRAPKPAPPLGRVINPEPEPPVSRTMPPPPVTFRNADAAKVQPPPPVNNAGMPPPFAGSQAAPPPVSDVTPQNGSVASASTGTTPAVSSQNISSVGQQGPIQPPGTVPMRQHATLSALNEKISNKINNIHNYLRSINATPEGVSKLTPEQLNMVAESAYEFGKKSGAPVPKTKYKGLEGDTLKAVIDKLSEQ